MAGRIRADFIGRCLVALWLPCVAGCVNVPDYAFSPFQELDADLRPPPPPPDAGDQADTGPAPDEGVQPDAGCIRQDEQCNGRDDDCDRIVDEDFDLDTNTDNCGACGVACRPAGGVGACVAGECVIERCEDGFADLDDDDVNGCEYACPGPVAPEDCNAVDDDCDGRVDEDLDRSVPDQLGVCSDALRPCNGADGFGEPDFASLPDYQAEEDLCDGLDNDCDGDTDEGQAGLGGPCTVGVGACVTEGVSICGPDRRSAVCDAEPAPPARDDAVCDGVDADCDGRTDEDAPGCVQCDGRVDFPCNGCPAGIAVPSGFACVPAGEFVMGSPAGEVGRLEREGPAHPVRITRPYLIQTTEVTQRAWAAFFPDDPSFFADNPRRPVERITWYEAVTYANALSAAEGYEACYVLEGCTDTPPGTGLICPTARFEGLDCDGYRLPTEAEWAKAARAGTDSRFWFGDDDGGLDMTDWYAGNSGLRTHDVGQLAPNPYGLYDVHGNVWEWVHDGFALYEDVLEVDPLGPDDPDERVRRGGTFGALPSEARSAVRTGERSNTRSPRSGMRLVRTAR